MDSKRSVVGWARWYSKERPYAAGNSVLLLAAAGGLLAGGLIAPGVIALVVAGVLAFLSSLAYFDDPNKP